MLLVSSTNSGSRRGPQASTSDRKATRGRRRLVAQFKTLMCPQDDNYIAVRDVDTGEYMMNGGFVVSMFQKSIQYGGTILHYTGSDVEVGPFYILLFNYFLNLSSPSPTH